MTVEATELQGQLQLPRKSTAPAGPKGYYPEHANGVIPTRPYRLDPRRAFVIVLTRPDASNAKPCSAKMAGGDFYPHTLAAAPGSSLVVENHDIMAHALMSDALPRLQGRTLPPGGQLRIDLPKQGKNLHLGDRHFAHVRADIHLLPGLSACTQPDADGKFRLQVAKAGTYTLRVLHRDRQLVARQLTIKAGRTQQLGTLKLPALSTPQAD
ncbi:MAG: hypothetical protein ACPGUV_12160 [Polyangiales bacterium]